MKVLVTGGAGFIGSHLCEKLINEGHKVYCVDNFSSGKYNNIKDLDMEFIYADISQEIPNVIKEVDIVYHQAASKKNICLFYPEYDLEVNGKGTLMLLRACKKYGVKKFIHASTGSVYGEVNGKITEDTPCQPVSYYGISKLAGENYVRYFSKYLKITILRYFHVYGSRQEDREYLGGVVAIFDRLSKEKKPLSIYGSGDQVRSFTHVSDVVEANLLAPEGIFNIASGIKVSIKELAQMFQDKYGNSGIVYKPKMEGDIFNFNVDNKKIREAGLTFKKFSLTL